MPSTVLYLKNIRQTGRRAFIIMRFNNEIQCLFNLAAVQVQHELCADIIRPPLFSREIA